MQNFLHAKGEMFGNQNQDMLRLGVEFLNFSA